MIHLNDLVFASHSYERVLPLLALSGNVESNPGPIIDNESDCLSVLSQNIRSIRRKFDYIKEQCLDFRIHVLCFSEKHLDANVTNESLMLENIFFLLFIENCNNSFRSLLIYVSDILSSNQRLDLELLFEDSVD